MFIISKLILLLFLGFIFYSLGNALYHLVRDTKTSTAVISALSWRIFLSILMFVFLWIAYALGWITPHSL
jgi:hypothetical protein